MWNQAQIEIVIAWAMWEAGLIQLAEAMAVWDRADKIPVYRCQDFMNWPHAKYGYRCKCGEYCEDGEPPPCFWCKQERAQLYEPTGRRRSFQILR
ncbi:MAG: hypothetical protein WCH99_12360 [Verrucomicrobiota bacterium]